MDPARWFVGWDTDSRSAVRWLVEIGRVLTVLAVLTGHVYVTSPSVALVAGDALASVSVGGVAPAGGAASAATPS